MLTTKAPKRSALLRGFGGGPLVQQREGADGHVEQVVHRARVGEDGARGVVAYRPILRCRGAVLRRRCRGWRRAARGRRRGILGERRLARRQQSLEEIAPSAEDARHLADARGGLGRSELLDRLRLGRESPRHRVSAL